MCALAQDTVTEGGGSRPMSPLDLNTIIFVLFVVRQSMIASRVRWFWFPYGYYKFSSFSFFFVLIAIFIFVSVVFPLFLV